MNRDEKLKLALLISLPITIKDMLELYPGIESERFLAVFVYSYMETLKEENIVDSIDPLPFFGRCGFSGEAVSYLAGRFQRSNV